MGKFPKRFSVQKTKYLRGLLEALAEGDSFLDVQVENVRDNLLVLTASGKNLDRLASMYGVERGTGTGVQDDDFRHLVPVLGMSPKQITHSLQKVIDAIYGPYATHANTTCSAPGTFYLRDGADLRVRCDDIELSVVFHSASVQNITQVTAQEAATIITDQSHGRLVATVVSNTRTGEEFVNIRSVTIGSQGFVQVLGGDAQSAFRFPEIRATRQAIGTFDISRYLGTSEMVYACISGVSPGTRMASVQRGDFVTIRQDSGFNQDNCGSFEVTFVDENSFRIKNGKGHLESSITQTHVDDFTFYRPDLGNILLASRPATVLQTAPRELTVLLPVTSPIVKRTLKGGHHFHGGASVVTSTSPTIANLGSTSGFPSSGSFTIIISRDHAEVTCSSVTANTITLVSIDGMPNSGAVYAPTTQTYYYYNSVIGNVLQGVQPSPPDLSGSPLKYSPRFSFTGKSANSLTGVYPDPAQTIGFEVCSQVLGDPNFFGSFLYDKGSVFIGAAQSTQIAETIQQGSSRTVVQVGDVSHFPETGHFALEFATKEQEAPIKYLGKVGNQALIIDPSHVFTRDHLKGVTLRLIRQLGFYEPKVDGSDYAVYLTGTSQARSLVSTYLRAIVAAGVTIKFKIIEPTQFWPVLVPLNSETPESGNLA